MLGLRFSSMSVPCIFNMDLEQIGGLTVINAWGSRPVF